MSRRSFITRSAGAAAALGLLRPARSLAASTADAPAFTHGVASGDPSVDGVVIWTRVHPVHDGKKVDWQVLRADNGIVVQEGKETVDADRDGTVQVLVSGLPAGTAFRYRFTLKVHSPDGGTAEHASIEGRTRTLPADPASLRIGVVSCGKYSDGYFNAYRELAGMDCDLVLHLGDYVYASGAGDRDPLDRWGTVRLVDNQDEATTLEAYRARYRQYRSDPDLQALHASVPVVAIWDDNDIANNAWRDGNQAGETGAAWARRKAEGQQAWAEYLPGRTVFGPDMQIWRRFQAGTLLDLVMLDTRLQRDRQVSNAAGDSSAANDDPDRTMLGATQRDWLVGTLASPATWHVIGQGIVMTHWRIVGGPESVGGMLGDVPVVQDEADGGVYWNSDGWDGYAYERAQLFEAFAAANGDVIVLTGDVHSSWANELVPDANPANAPVGVELVAPAASTRPFASNVQGATPPFEAAFTAANPWIKWCDMDANGFLVVDLDHARAVARWFQVDAQHPGTAAAPLLSWVTERGSHRLLPHIG